jgi:hypothetical protein
MNLWKLIVWFVGIMTAVNVVLMPRYQLNPQTLFVFIAGSPLFILVICHLIAERSSGKHMRKIMQPYREYGVDAKGKLQR